MDSPATSPRIRFLDAKGQSIEGPTEWMPALVEIEMDATGWASAELLVQGLPLPLTLRRLEGRPRVIAEWPRSGPGRYAVSVSSSAGDDSDEVMIPPAKLSQASFTTLLTDLEARLPAAVAIALQRAGGMSGVTILPPEETTVAQELARLRRAVYGTEARPGLVHVLHELARDPHHMLMSETLWVDRARARRPHPAQLAYAVTLPGNLGTDGIPLRVIDQRVEPTVDLYENRLVRLFIDQVQLRLRRLDRYLQGTKQEQVHDLVRAMVTELQRARRHAKFLDLVTPIAHLPTRITMVILKRPHYRAALEGYLELHRSLAVRMEDPRLDAPLENVPGLYQLWGTMQVITVLLEVAVQHGYRLIQQRLVHREPSGAFVRLVPAGHIALSMKHFEHQTELRLVPEWSFGKTGRLRSISYSQIPDVTVEVRRPGQRPHLYLFDPKYKLAGELSEDAPSDGKPTKVDIDKMHTYRDAIRDQSNQRVVRCAATLYPGPSIHYAQGIEAISADPEHVGRLEERVSAILQEALDDTSAPVADLLLVSE